MGKWRVKSLPYGICIKKPKYKFAEPMLLFLLVLSIIILCYSAKFLNLTISLICISIIMVFPMKNILGKAIALIYYIILLLLVQNKIIVFDFIPQARFLIENNTNIFYWFSVGNPHAIRLLAAYPAYIIVKLYKVNLDLAYSYYSIVLFTITYLFIIDSGYKLQKKKYLLDSKIKNLLALIPLFILAFIMNGRLIVAYLGFCILIHLFLDLFNANNKPNMIVFLIKGSFGFFLTTVSSGTMITAIIYIIISMGILISKEEKMGKHKRTIFVTILVLSPLLYKVFIYIWMMTMRNINYYGGGISGVFNMLNHGIGKYFLADGSIYLIGSMIVLLIVLIVNVKYLKFIIVKKYNYYPILFAINLSAYGFLFGYSTGLMIILPLIILILTKL